MAGGGSIQQGNTCNRRLAGRCQRGAHSRSEIRVTVCPRDGGAITPQARGLWQSLVSPGFGWPEGALIRARYSGSGAYRLRPLTENDGSSWFCWVAVHWSRRWRRTCTSWLPGVGSNQRATGNRVGRGTVLKGCNCTECQNNAIPTRSEGPILGRRNREA